MSKVVGQISRGMVVLLGIAQDDSQQDIDFLAKKIAELRIFEDSEGRFWINKTKELYCAVYPISYRHGGDVHTFVEDASGNFWGNDRYHNGLVHIDRKTDS